MTECWDRMITDEVDEVCTRPTGHPGPHVSEDGWCWTNRSVLRMHSDAP